ncbi:asparaginyl-tRNA synthetase [Phanerochaete sordida]|uniref:Asparagine--tRNA ligase, mitochondrial n=1 Tax=Phanerochaete sordida TaxID=48140 RepID=A0A9P3LLJ4_9APHY|nr:asparaginyl-tRNA synthetase [Phanerochaete sordida]
MFLRRSLATLSSLPPTVRQLLAPGTPSSSAPIQVHGWVRSVRRQKRVAFAVVSDGSSTEGLQAVFPDPSLVDSLSKGCAVKLTGVLVDSPGAGQAKELQVQAVDVVGECDPEEYPMNKREMNVDYLRDHCHLRTRTNHMAAIVRLRDSTIRTLQDYFTTLGFTYAHTPLIVSNDCEGAGETFRVLAPSEVPPTSTAKQASSSSSAAQDNGKPPEHFFGRPAYLTVSSQLHLEALATSLSRVYTISPCFRAERSQTGRHLSEFWMLEAEWAFTNKVDDVCQVVEGAVKQALSQSNLDLQLLRNELPESRLEAFEKAASAEPWTRITYTDAIRELEKAQSASKVFKYDPIWGSPLRSEHERWIAEQVANGPAFVTDYPTELKPFYMRLNDDGKTVACFDLLVPHLGELVGGSLREERMASLRKGMKREGLDAGSYDWYLDLRKFGGAPHGGFGLGFERLMSWMTGVENVRECIPMPRWAGRMLL